MKARDHRLSAFIVFKCSKTPMKHEAQVLKLLLNPASLTKNNEKILTNFLALYAEYKLLFLVLFSVIISLCCQIF